MMSSRRKVLTDAIWGGLLVSLPDGRRAFSGARRRVSVDNNNVAIRGYDPVAYFTEGKPTQGSPDFEFQWQGARWRFVSAQHRDLFSKRPDAYAPRFGGFCAGAIIDGVFVRPDPEAWAIVDGKLYLNGDKQGLAVWRKDAPANIAKAERRWDDLSQ